MEKVQPSHQTWISFSGLMLPEQGKSCSCFRWFQGLTKTVYTEHLLGCLRPKNTRSFQESLQQQMVQVGTTTALFKLLTDIKQIYTHIYTFSPVTIYLHTTIFTLIFFSLFFKNFPMLKSITLRF